MLVISMGVTVDGFIKDREGDFAWGAPDEEQFAFHLEQVGELGACILGRNLYETMLPWENDPAMRADELTTAFADVWSAIPKVVFSRTLERVEGNARLAEGELADEVATVRAATENDIEIGGADIAGQALELGLVDEVRMFRYPVIVGGGTPLLPPVADPVPLELVETRLFSSQVIFERYRC